MAMSAIDITRNAFRRAMGRTSAVHFLGTTTGGFAVYAVDSSQDTDTAYSVTVRGDHFRCTCQGGLRSACWHRAAVAAVRASRVGFGLPADGHTAEDERASAA